MIHETLASSLIRPQVLLICGAYGRKATRQDWLEGKDFRMYGTSTYLSIRDVRVILANKVKFVALIVDDKEIVGTYNLQTGEWLQ